MLGFLPAKHCKWFILTPWQVYLGKLPHSLWKAKKSNSTKTKKKVYFKFFECSWWKGSRKLEYRSSHNVSLVSPRRPLPSPKCFCSFSDFLKLLRQPHKLHSQPNVKKSFWNQKKSSCVEHHNEALLYFQRCQGSKKKPSGLQADPCHSGSLRLAMLRGALGPCSHISTFGRRVIRDLRSFYNI